MKKFLKTLFHRAVIVGLAIVVQLVLLVAFIWRFDEYFVYFYTFSVLLSIAVVLYIINGRSNPGFKIAWIIPILLFPIFGGLFYLMFGGNKVSTHEQKRLQAINDHLSTLLFDDNAVMERLEAESLDAANQARYIERYALAPIWDNTYTEYLTPGETFFQRLMEELEKAEQFIFMEYFIIQEGKMWDPILELLVRKAKQGVDVRLIYDDMGSLMTLPYGYDKRLERMGIPTCVFNPFRPVLSSRLNNRDHRKITVIDGHTGFTGGINLADEYINAYPKHGHWKDASIMLKGDGVWNLTAMFLSLWAHLRGTHDAPELYRPYHHLSQRVKPEGYVQPFCDSPLDNEAVGETVYLNLITKAKRYVHICSPYLIIDNEMVTALCNAAKSGVEVCIITPHIGDKWYVQAVSRAYYSFLVENGVHIYEYTPGFIHAKTYAVDDEYAVVGTINMDYRSLYLHFECGVWMYRTASVAKVEEDFQQTCRLSREVTLEECRKVGLPRRIGRAVLRAFSPLM